MRWLTKWTRETDALYYIGIALVAVGTLGWVVVAIITYVLAWQM